MRGSRIAVGALVALGLAAAAPAGGSGAPEPARVVLVTRDCAALDFLCPAFRRAARRTGTTARIVAPDHREDITATFALLGRQGYDLVIGDPDLGFQLADAAERTPRGRFAAIDVPIALATPRPPNVAVVEVRARGAAYLAGWLAGRMERLRPGPDVVGAVGGVRIPPVDELIVAFKAGARRAAPNVTVLRGYSGNFVDPTACAVVAEGQIAKGAGVLLDAAGGCGRGTLDAARGARRWAIGVDEDRSGLGPHILTSVVKRYDRAFALLMRQARDDRLPADRAIVMGIRRGGAELGRISPRVPTRVRRELAAVRRDLVSGRIRPPGPGDG
ncbi:MAG TPA: BMP family ABC transporter substrate-binding protein [Miltoncostaeaceae bacterium]|nr:BMP family ABC transporter substrate-binding protein [Miltoncostaeaceae bacterium]